MTWLSDRAVDRLREAAAWPELDERYTITGLAGGGGMGAVYIARDGVLDRDVAVKVLDVADRPGLRAHRFKREAGILARLDHPGIVPIHDAGTLPDGRTFYVMKLVRGQRLDDVMTTNPPLAERLGLFAKVLEAVSFAHARGIVHRDLKPGNIMVGEFGEVFVMDWGVAQEGGEPEGSVVGTPGFMAPEQEGGAPVDARADIYALGQVLRRLLPDDAAAPLAGIALKATALDAGQRYESVHAFADDLSRFRDQRPVAAYRESVSERVVRVYRRYELAVVLIVAYVAMRAVLLLWARI